MVVVRKQKIKKSGFELTIANKIEEISRILRAHDIEQGC